MGLMVADRFLVSFLDHCQLPFQRGHMNESPFYQLLLNFPGHQYIIIFGLTHIF